MPFFVPTGGDMKFYSDWGLQISHGILTNHQAFYGLPGYPYFLGFLYRILNFDLFWTSIFAALIQSLADSLTAWLIWRIALDIFPPAPDSTLNPGHFIGFAAAIAWAFYQPSQAFSAVLMPTALAVVAFWYCVWTLSRRRDSFSIWKPWLPVGLIIGFQSMLVATILFLIPLALAAIILRRQTLKPSLAAAALLIAGVFAGSSPCWLHNYLIAHEPVMLSAHSGLNFYIGNNPQATGYPKMPQGMAAAQEGMLKDSIALAEKAEGHPLKHYEVSQYWSAKAHAYISAHPKEWLRLMARKFYNFWNAFQYDDLSLITLFSRAGLLAPGPRFGLVAALAIPGILLALIRRSRAGWIVAAVLLQMAALMPVFVTERYRLAAVPGLLILAAYGIWELWNFLVRARWLPAGGYACVSIASAFCVATPPADASLWSLDFYNTGIKAIEQGDYPAARRDLETAYRYVPGNADVNFALGLMYQDQGDSRRAETFYARAIQFNPRHASAWNNLGVLASKSRVWAVAQQFLDRAIEIDPTDPKTHFLEARADAELGQWDRATSSIQTALRLRPNQKEFQQLATAISTHGPLPPQ